MRDDLIGLRPSRRSILAASFASPFLAMPLSDPAFAARKAPPTALIVPLSGAHAAIGRNMARAAALAQARDSRDLIVLDSGGTPGGAAAAAGAALKRGAGLILGPLLAGEARAVIAAVGGRVPIVTFSNDRMLRESGAFLMGITADQTVGAVLRYARGRGVRRIAVAGNGDDWGRQVSAAAQDIAGREGIEIVVVEGRNDATLLSASGGAHRDGQLLCAFSNEPDAGALAAIEGGWLASPDPSGFQSFASAFEAANGSPPGTIAMLAYDAATMAARLRQAGATDRPGLLATSGFPGVCGAFRFREDGSATRSLAILAVEHGSYRVIAAPSENAANG